MQRVDVGHLYRNAGALILKIIYGYDVNTDGDKFVAAVEAQFAKTARFLTDTYLVDYYPICKFVFISMVPFEDLYTLLSEISSFLVPICSLEAISFNH